MGDQLPVPNRTMTQAPASYISLRQELTARRHLTETAQS